MYYFIKSKQLSETAYFETKRVFKDTMKNFFKVLEIYRKDNIPLEITIGIVKDIDKNKGGKDDNRTNG